MTGARHCEVRPGAYHDSVRLMQVSKAVGDSPGVRAALIAMATELNRELAGRLDVTVPTAGPNDLLVAIVADDEEALEAARARLDAELTAPAARARSESSTTVAPRTVASALRQPSELPSVVLVSTPGRSAFLDAMDALDAGASVMIFSDNVPLEHELRLKRLAAERDLLVMGPDCGTAVVGGVGLGFANVVRPGPVGLVAASGTGAQQVMCLLAAAGVGISHCLGTGGRDLSEAVGGTATRTAVTSLDADPDTELILVIGKPGAPAVADDLRKLLDTLDTPAIFAPLGPGHPDLTTTVEDVLRRLGHSGPTEWPRWLPSPRGNVSAGTSLTGNVSAGTPLTGNVSAGTPLTGNVSAETSHGNVSAETFMGPGGRRGALRGLFAGGTLCIEASLVASETLGSVPLASIMGNRDDTPGSTTAKGDSSDHRPSVTRASLGRTRPRRPGAHDQREGGGGQPGGGGHWVVDFGDDALTDGRAHPMMDDAIRRAWLRREAADPEVAVVLLDVVLGHGAHPDPAGELAPLIAAARAEVVVTLVGTSDDPQGLQRQAETLRAAGAAVFASNAEATRYAVGLCG